MKHGICVGVVAAAVLMGSSLQAWAQEQQPLPLDRFNPSWAGDRFFGLTSPFVTGHGTPHASLLLEYAHAPLVLVRQGATDEELGVLVEHQPVLHANGTLPLWDRVGLNMDIPIAFAQGGNAISADGQNFQAPSGSDLGDLRFGLRIRLWGEQQSPFQVGLGGYIWVPTGSQDSGDFVSSGSVRGMPQLTVGGTIGSFVYGVDVGPEIRDSQSFVNITQGTSLRWGLAGGVLLLQDKSLQLGGELLGGIVVEDVQQRTTNLELLLGGKYRFLQDFVLAAGAGPGLTRGVGTPDVRALIGLSYSPDGSKPADSDGDGIVDDQDACPSKPGVPDKDPAKNGCPQADRDGDGIADAQDACPDLAGPPNDDPQKNGCPDSDGDGIFDNRDACPQVKGIASEDPTKNGCPESDRDGDGILDKDDACPDVKGIADADPQKNGCPDTDGDGIFDKQDACPDVKGLANQDPALNGCPDTDGDGIFDKQDACPKEKGPANADPTKHGCPKVVVTETQILILERVEFETAKAVIRPESNPLLDQVAQVFKEHPEITKVEVQGHTDNRGGAAYNKVLSQGRADAVKKALVSRGIEASRLTTKGYGQDKPIAPNDTDDGRQKNRRVQFEILERSKSPSQP